MRLTALIALLTVTALAGCATRPVNPPLTLADPTTGYRLETRENKVFDDQNIVILAFSGGGTRAAAFSYGVLEFLARTEVKGPRGAPVRLLDEVDADTGHPEVAQCARRRAGEGAERKARRSAQQADQGAHRQSGGLAVVAAGVQALAHVQQAFGVAGHHARGVQRDVALAMQGLQGLQAGIGGGFVVENGEKELVHRGAVPWERKTPLRL